jgi:hypothetical protein
MLQHLQASRNRERRPPRLRRRLVRSRLFAGGRRIRTIGPCREGTGLCCGIRTGGIETGQPTKSCSFAGYRRLESISPQRRVCESSVPRRRKMPKSRKNTPLSCRRRQSALVDGAPLGVDVARLRAQHGKAAKRFVD